MPLNSLKQNFTLPTLLPVITVQRWRTAIWASFSKVNEIAGSVGSPLIAEDDIADYVDAVLADYDADDDTGKLEHIMTQKWIASFGWGADLYTDYRRTGFPVLHDANTDDLSFTIRNREFPNSFPWPTANLQVNGNAPAQRMSRVKMPNHFG